MCVCCVCVYLLCVCLCVVLTLWLVRRLVNLADATAQPQLQPKPRCACLAAAACLLPSAFFPSLTSCSLHSCPFVATARRRMEFCNFFGILKLLFLLLQLSRERRGNFSSGFPSHLPLPPFNFSAVSPSCCSISCLRLLYLSIHATSIPASHCWPAFPFEASNEGEAEAEREKKIDQEK